MPRDDWKRANNRARYGPGRPREAGAFSKCPKGFKCPDCGGRMVVRVNARAGNLFAGCKKFPECRGTLPYDGAKN